MSYKKSAIIAGILIVIMVIGYFINPAIPIIMWMGGIGFLVLTALIKVISDSFLIR